MIRLSQREREQEDKKDRKHGRVRQREGRVGIRGISQMEMQKSHGRATEAEEFYPKTDKWCVAAVSYLRISLTF